MDDGALLSGHKVHDSVEDGVAVAVSDGGALLLKDGVHHWLLDGMADGPGLVPALLLQLCLALWNVGPRVGGRDGQHQKTKHHLHGHLVKN
jgi:hypothetical protein